MIFISRQTDDGSRRPGRAESEDQRHTLPVTERPECPATAAAGLGGSTSSVPVVVLLPATGRRQGVRSLGNQDWRRVSPANNHIAPVGGNQLLPTTIGNDKPTSPGLGIFRPRRVVPKADGVVVGSHGAALQTNVIFAKLDL